VFWHFDGRRWTGGGEDSEATEQGTQSEGRSYSYALTLEPHHRRWVFALDAPEMFPHELTRTSDGLLQARETVRERRRYELVSRIQAATPGPLSAAARQRALQLPGEPSAAIRELIDTWRAEAPSDLELVKRSLRHFHEQPFVYTLQPPSIAGDAVTGFLFQTRRGFCEHYAGAFVYLMRAAGVPARVVTGYQGGHWNPLGRFLEVQQADAHAWAEVWLARQGWVRIDPTAAVAPERIERESIFAARTGLDGAVMFDGPAAQALGQRLSSLRGLVTEAGLLWASADHAWHNWVLDYGADSQNRLLARLGISDWSGVAQLLAGLLSGFGALLYLLLRRAEPGPDPALRAYRRVARKLERHGMIRRSAEGWSDFALRVAVTRPELAAPLTGFTALFLTIRYGRGWDAGDLRLLERLARDFPRD
jgi:transglutaminase-like putative cysteine protease